MKVQTLSVLVGSFACNAECPFCVARMTPANGITAKPVKTNSRNLEIACALAKSYGATTCLITGKGEPTLFPTNITACVNTAKRYFPIVELQTNGLRLKELWDNRFLGDWYDEGLSTIALSIVHWEASRNREIYTPNRPEYPELGEMVDLVHRAGFSCRLCCMLVKGYIDSEDSAWQMIQWAKDHHVEQLTMRSIVSLDAYGDTEAAKWATEHWIGASAMESIIRGISTGGKMLMTLAHGGEVYDVGGQNVCLYNCLTLKPDGEDLRQLIFFPDGHIRYDWRYPGAILL